MTAVASSTRFQISLQPIPVVAEDITTDAPPRELEIMRSWELLRLLDNLSDFVATNMRGIFSLSNQSDNRRSKLVGGILESTS